MITIHARRSWRCAWLLSAAIAATGLFAACNHSNPSTSASGVPEPAAPPTPAGPLTAAPPGQTSDANMPQPAPMPSDQPGSGGGPPAYTAAPPSYAQPGYASAAPTYGTPGYAPPAYGGGGPAYSTRTGYAGGAPVQVVQAVDQGPQLSDQQLDDLLAPVALYPDPLIAVMLPAATYPDELGIAAQWVSSNGSPPDYAIDAQPWDPAIKALAHSPSVLVWMNNNPDWTRTLGAAFTYQPQDVMNSIQRLRAEAQAAGALADTPQQIVVVQDRIICIEPAVTNVIYVPVYDWHVVYVRRDRRPVINFYVGCNVGVWLSNDCDWDDASITIGAHWDRGWDHRWDGDRNARATHVTVNNTTVVNNRTTINNATVNNTRVVQVGGTAWKRDAAKPVPILPASVTPAKSAGHLPPTPRGNAVQPIAPRGGTVQTPTPRGGTVQTPTPRGNVVQPIAPRGNTVPAPVAPPKTPEVQPLKPVMPPTPVTPTPVTPRPLPTTPDRGRGVPITPPITPALPNERGTGRGALPTQPITPALPNDRGNGRAGDGRTPGMAPTPATPVVPNDRGGRAGNSGSAGQGRLTVPPNVNITPVTPDRGASRGGEPPITPALPAERGNNLDRGQGRGTPPPTVTPPTPAERGAERGADRGRGAEVAPPPATPPGDRGADRGADRGRGPASQPQGNGRGG